MGHNIVHFPGNPGPLVQGRQLTLLFPLMHQLPVTLQEGPLLGLPQAARITPKPGDRHRRQSQKNRNQGNQPGQRIILQQEKPGKEKEQATGYRQQAADSQSPVAYPVRTIAGPMVDHHRKRPPEIQGQQAEGRTHRQTQQHQQAHDQGPRKTPVEARSHQQAEGQVGQTKKHEAATRPGRHKKQGKDLPQGHRRGIKPEAALDKGG